MELLLSLGLVLILGLIGGILFEKIKLPKIVGMIVIGILLGPSVLNWFSPDTVIQGISGDLRMIALVVILTRSGLSLDLPSLKKIGRPAILMSFLPATFEIAAAVIFAPMLLGVTYVEAFLVGSTVAAVSPAIIVPRMIKFIDEGYGKKHQIPKLLLAGSSVDDVFVIVIFYAFLGLEKNNTFSSLTFLNIPISIVLGIGLGVAVGFLLAFLYKKVKFSVPYRILISLSASFLMIAVEHSLEGIVAVSSLLGVISMGVVLLAKDKANAREMQKGYNNIWNFFEIILFVLVGAKFNFTVATSYGFSPFILILIMLLFRSVGVLVCLYKTKLTKKERIFAVISYIPKATVQASIGGICLDQGLPCGNLVLSVAVISILVTAPLGALLIDNLYSKLITNEEEIEDVLETEFN